MLRINGKLKSSKLTNFGFNQNDYSYGYDFATIVCMLFRTELLVPKVRYRYSVGDISEEEQHYHLDNVASKANKLLHIMASCLLKHV